MPKNAAPLVADGGDIRLVRRVSAYVFGTRSVTWPEDYKGPETELPDDREFGWVAKLDGPKPGLSGRRFSRGDVTIDAVEKITNTERVLDDVTERSGGDVQFETLIQGDGLAGQTPGVDFQVGDRITVRFWGRLLPGQLVTEIGWDEQGAYAKIGGQMLNDLDALARTREEIDRTVRKEREQNSGAIAAVRRTAEAAKTTAAGNTEKLETVETRLRGLQADQGPLRDELARAMETASSLQTQLGELNERQNKRNDEFSDKLRDTNAKVSEMDAALDGFSKEDARIREQVGDLVATADEASAAAAANGGKLRELEANLGDLNTRIGEEISGVEHRASLGLKDQAAEFDDKLRQLRAELDDNIDKAKLAQDVMAELTKEGGPLREQLSEQVQKAVEASPEIADANRKAKEAADNLRDLTGDDGLLTKLQNEAILANQVVGDTNTRAIDILTGSVKTQDAINRNQAKWNEASEAATAANSRSIEVQAALNQLAFPDANLTPAIGGKATIFTGTPTEGEHLINSTAYPLPASRLPADVNVFAAKTVDDYFAVASGIDLRIRFAVRFDEDAKSGALTLWLYGRKRWSKVDGVKAITVVKRLSQFVEGDKETTLFDEPWKDTDVISVDAPKGKWVSYDFVVKLKADVEEVRVQVNTNTGSSALIAGPYISAFAPIQAMVDRAQELSLRALRQRGEMQDEINRITRETADADREATRANTAAIKALARIDTGASLVLYEDLTDEEILDKDNPRSRVYKPTWATAASYQVGKSSDLYKNNPDVQDVWAVYSNVGMVRCRTNFAKVEPNAVYVLSFYAMADKPGSKLFIQMHTPAGEPHNSMLPMTRSVNTETGERIWVEGKPTSYAVFRLELPTGKMRKFEFRMRMAEDVSAISFGLFYWNHSSGAKATQYIGDLEFSLDVPTQEAIDYAQNMAIKAIQENLKTQGEINKAQAQINEMTAAITRANTSSIRAMSRLTNTSSLIRYKDLTNEEILEKGMETVYMPFWATAFDKRVDGKNVMDGCPYPEAWMVPASVTGMREAERGWMGVEAGKEYKLSFWAKSNKDDTCLFIQVFAHPTEPYNPFRLVGKVDASTGEAKLSAPTTYAASNIRLTRKWQKFEQVVRIEDGIRRIALARFYFNHGNGRAKGDQYVAGVEFGLNTPSQADVDEAQNKSITSLQKGVEALEVAKAADDAWREERERTEERLKEANQVLSDLISQTAEYSNRTLFRSAGYTAEDKYISIDANGRIWAKGDWGGRAIVDAWNTRKQGFQGDYLWITVRNGFEEQVSTNRQIHSGRGYENHDMIVHYQVYNGRPVAKDMEFPAGHGYITGSKYVTGHWVEVGKVKTGPVKGKLYVQWKTPLTAADRECTYMLRVLVNGYEVHVASWRKIGPLFPSGDGRYTLDRLWVIDVPQGQELDVSIAAAFHPGPEDGPDQARAGAPSGHVRYVEA